MQRRHSFVANANAGWVLARVERGTHAQAFAHAEAGVLAPFNYAQIISAANFGMIVFGGQTSSCMRFQVTSETRDLAMTVVAPSGAVFTNNSGGVAACTDCPRVVVLTATNGFYTVTIANRNGAGLESSFTLKAGLYNSGNNPNCASPTPSK